MENLPSHVLESLNHEQEPFLVFLGFSGLTHLSHEICNFRATIDLLKWIFWVLLGKVLRIVHANFHEVLLRFDPISIVFRRGVGLFSARSFSEN